jgi:hypothetical protein
MASLRYRNDKWQVQVRRYGHTPQSKSFQSKADAQRWARHAEAELDRTLIPNDPRLLSTITIAEVLTRYRDTHTQAHRGHVSEAKRIEVFLRTSWCRLPLAKAGPALFSRYRDTRLKQVQPGTVTSYHSKSSTTLTEAVQFPVLAITHAGCERHQLSGAMDTNGNTVWEQLITWHHGRRGKIIIDETPNFITPVQIRQSC